MPPRCLSFIRQRRRARVRGHNEAVRPCPRQCSKMQRSEIGENFGRLQREWPAKRFVTCATCTSRVSRQELTQSALRKAKNRVDPPAELVNILLHSAWWITIIIRQTAVSNFVNDNERCGCVSLCAWLLWIMILHIWRLCSPQDNHSFFNHRLLPPPRFSLDYLKAPCLQSQGITD